MVVKKILDNAWKGVAMRSMAKIINNGKGMQRDTLVEGSII